MNRSVAIFGAGKQGRTVASLHMINRDEVICFIDNSADQQGKRVFDIPVVSLKEFMGMNLGCPVVIAVDQSNHESIIEQLRCSGLENYEIFDKLDVLKRERVRSFSYPTENEDVILYHVLRDHRSVFWIDVGSNDPDIGNVTRLFYDKGHRGINIDMEPGLIEISKKERPEDINLCIGVGKESGDKEYYSQGDLSGLSTFVQDNVLNDRYVIKRTRIMTLKEICEKYAKGRDITFLKIDVEGFEKDVLMGADFESYRPEILVIESTLPLSDIPNYEAWEDIVLDNRYHFVYEHGVNRYYVADEHVELDNRFIPWNLMSANYCIIQSDMAYYS